MNKTLNVTFLEVALNIEKSTYFCLCQPKKTLPLQNLTKSLPTA